MSSRATGEATPAAPQSGDKDSARAAASAQTRRALVAAATELFAERGLTGPSLDAICAHAGYTRGAFYVHFKTRDDLIIEVVEEVLGGFIDAIIAGGGAGVDVATIVRTFALAVQTGGFPFRGEVRPHQILEACSRSPKLHGKYLELLADARARLAAIVRSDQEAARVRRDLSPEAIAQLLLAVVLGVEVATELSVPYDAGAVSEDVLKMLAPDVRAPDVRATEGPATGVRAAEGTAPEGLGAEGSSSPGSP